MIERIIANKPLSQSNTILKVEEDMITTIIPVGQYLSYGKTVRGIKFEIEISNIDLIQLMEDKKNIDSITAEGFQLVYKVESENSVIFREAE